MGTADKLTAWRGDEETVSTFWRIDCDDDGFTWERRWPGRKSQIEDVAWERITRICWECGEGLCMDNFHLIADHEDVRRMPARLRRGFYDLRGECQCQGAERGSLVRRRAEGSFQEAAQGDASRAGHRNRRDGFRGGRGR